MPLVWGAEADVEDSLDSLSLSLGLSVGNAWALQFRSSLSMPGCLPACAYYAWKLKKQCPAQSRA